MTAATPQLELWRSRFGADYTIRNDRERPERVAALRRVLDGLDVADALEIGCNVGWNLRYLRRLGVSKVWGVEPQRFALTRARARSPDLDLVEADAGDLPFRDRRFDLVFTSGVLIHIGPSQLPTALAEMARVSRRYLLVIEYDHPSEVEVEYRGHAGALWKRDHGAAVAAALPRLRAHPHRRAQPRRGLRRLHVPRLRAPPSGVVTTVAIIQARMGSSSGCPARCWRRPRRALDAGAGDRARPRRGDDLRWWSRRRPTAADDARSPVAVAAGAGVYRGEHRRRARPLPRRGPRTTAADVVVRLTADCPLLDPAVIDAVVEGLLATAPGCDYASNTVAADLPARPRRRGDAAHHAGAPRRLARAPAHREHVTAYLHRQPGGFARLSVCADRRSQRPAAGPSTPRSTSRPGARASTPGRRRPRPRRTCDRRVAGPARSWPAINADVPQRSWRHAAAESRRHG
jgi:pseudaminic acid biosynthesis-associated methylase